MVQLQKSKEDLEKAKIQVVAVSYDSVDILKEFSKRAKVEFSLLSDKNSKTIDAWGVRNKDVAGGRIDGVPHPGTFLVGADGKITAKLFYEGYRKRHVAKDIIEAAKPKQEEKRGEKASGEESRVKE